MQLIAKIIFYIIEESTNFDFSFQTNVAQSFASIHGRKELFHFTIAFWMRTNDEENYGTAISYAVKKNGKVDDNALYLNDYSNFNLAINNQTQPLEFSANDGEWHHIAITWTSTTGLWTVFKDGVKLLR